MRRVVFVGNCQAQALTDAFNRFVAPFTGERAFHIPAFRDDDEAHRAALERADVIVELVFDFSRRSDPADLGLTAPVIAVPYVNCQFLWPYAYEAHPRSARSEFSDSGPYPIQLSDAFLNRLMREGVPEEEAAARYLDLDINQKVRLDRRLEMTLALQRQRDEKTGFAVADLMERYFREEPIFLTPYHPSRRIFLHVAQRCFARLGVAEHLIARLPRLIRRSLFLQDALPVHPRLAVHFGLVWANEVTRYPFWLDGDFTFAEFIGRYLRFDWCEDFARGHYHARQGQNAEAIARLRAGLGAYPEADRAWVLLSHVYTAEGALPEALAAAREAVSRNPRDGEYFAHLGNLLTNAGEVASARVAYERAVALEPEHTPWLRLLALHWERQGKRAEAGALVATLADKDPLDYELHVQRGHLLAGRGDSAGAVMVFSHALGLAPHIEGVRAARSHTLAALERWEEAIADARAALAETPENRDLRRHLGNLLRASGDAAGAEAVFREAIRDDPSDPDPYRGLAAALAAQGREEAAARLSASIACVFEGAAPPDDRESLEGGWALFRMQDFAAAASWFRNAGESAAEQFCLSHAKNRAGDLTSAIEASWQAVSLAPHDARYFGLLGHLLAADGKHATAERMFRRALFLNPGHEGAQEALSHSLYALGRWNEALEAAREALLQRRADVSLLRHTQHLMTLTGRASEKIDPVPPVVSPPINSLEKIEIQSQPQDNYVTKSQNKGNLMRLLEDPADAIAVNDAYLLLLGRNPESAEVVHYGAKIPRTIGQLRADTMATEEYANRQRLDLIALHAEGALNKLGGLRYEFNVNSDQVIFLQTADPDRYFNMLMTSARYNRLYCQRWGLNYQAFIGIKRGYYPHHAMLNRTFLLNELSLMGYRGWVIYVDADAIAVRPEEDISAKLKNLREKSCWMSLYSVRTPDDPNYVWSEINTGVFAVDLAANRARLLVKFWQFLYSDVIKDEEFRHADTWDKIINDQNSLCELLLIFNRFFDLVNEVDISQEIGRPFFQVLRSGSSNISSDEELANRCARIAELGETAWSNAA